MPVTGRHCHGGVTRSKRPPVYSARFIRHRSASDNGKKSNQVNLNDFIKNTVKGVLKDLLTYYFAMLGKSFGMRQARIWLTAALVKLPDLTSGVCASLYNLTVKD